MLQFLKEYLKHPRSVGAIAPSSRRLAKSMMQPIDFESASCIMEFGPGTGVFTRELIRRRKRDTLLILVEQNEDFYHLLKKKYRKEENLIIVNGSAEQADVILRKNGLEQVDYVVSGLPFTSLPKEISIRIFEVTKKIIGEGGLFITFQYTLIKKKFFEQYFLFEDCIHVMKNLPPAYVFVLKR